MDVQDKITKKIILIFILIASVLVFIMALLSVNFYLAYKERYSIPVTNIQPNEEVIYDIDTVLEQERISDESDYSYDNESTVTFSSDYSIKE